MKGIGIYGDLTYTKDGVKARVLNIVRHTNGRSRLGHLFVLQSGALELAGKAYTLSEFAGLVETKEIRTSVVAGERLFVPEIFGCRLGEVLPIVKEREFLRELRDIVRELNDEPTTLDICRSAYEAYVSDPTEDKRQELRRALEDVPEHLDIWLLPFPRKPEEIRLAAYGGAPRSD